MNLLQVIKPGRTTGHCRPDRRSNVLRQTAYSLAPNIVTVAEHIINTLHNGGKVLTCGNGGSAADAQHFAAELVGRYRRERPGWSAIALTVDPSVLTSLCNDYGFEQVFARQVQAWDGQAISW